MVLELKAIQKRFGGVQALSRGDLEVRAGEVHLLLGENGAGKSTLMKIVAGMHRAEGGEIVWQGRKSEFKTPAEAQRAGIAMVHQESLLAPHLTVAENVWLGREPASRWGVLRRGETLDRTARLIEEHGFPLRAEWRVERLGPAGRQLVEICRALAHGSDLLIFDEPTSALSAPKSAEVLKTVSGLKMRGLAVIYITHRMSELREVGDRATVLRDGATVFSAPMAQATNRELIRHMAGREVAEFRSRAPQPPGEELLGVEEVSARGRLQSINLGIRAGEVVGLAGLVGAGRTELLRAIFGVDGIDAGKIRFAGREVVIRSPRDAAAIGLALVPEDRQRQGLAVGRPVAENISLASLNRLSPGGIIRSGRESDFVSTVAGKVRLSPAAVSMGAGKLSGGNQQKAVIAKWIARGAKVFLFDEPTRGIDLGAKREVFELIDELARGGAGILLASSEMQELQQMADRILVMKAGRIVAELPPTSSQEEILRFATMGDA